MIIECPKCEKVIPAHADITSHLENPLMVCPACDQLFSLSQVKNNPIDRRIQEIRNELLLDNRVQKATNWCEEC